MRHRLAAALVLLSSMPAWATTVGEPDPPTITPRPPAAMGRLDALLDRQDERAHRALASVCVGCGLPDDKAPSETTVPVLPALVD